jgi:hypothetical protein
MNRACFVALPLAFLCAAQQLPRTRPDINSVNPLGAQRGTDVDVIIRGRNMQEAAEIRFATPFLSAKILNVQHNQIRARIHVDAAAEPGRHDLRLIAPQGSTVAWFDVGTRPESTEKEPNNDIARAMPIEFPVLINGVIQNGDYDYFKFTARAGQTVTFDVSAQRFESSIDSVLSLLDAEGREMAYIDDFYWFKDPHLVYTFEKPGTYYLRLYGTGESGSPNGVYRLVAGEMPQVVYVMPVGGERGKIAEIRLSGVNLKNVDGAVLGAGLAKAEVISTSDRSATIRLKLSEDIPPGLHRLHVTGAALPVPFVVSDLPQVVATTETARKKQDPLPIAFPVVANGVIDTPGSGHYFAFKLDEPKKVLLAVDAMRLNNHLDPIVILYDESGKRIAYQDDPAVNSAKRPANVDPHLVVDLKPGRYIAFVRDNAFRGDPTYAYRFTLKSAEPDFTAGVVGSDDSLFRGRKSTVTIRVRRLEGWNTPVEVWAEHLPEGVSGPSKVIVPIEPTKYKGTCGEIILLDGTEVEYPLEVASNAPGGLKQIQFRARGVMNGRTVERVVHATYWWSSTRKIWGPAETTPLYATITDLPGVVLEAPDRVPAPRGGEGAIKVVVTRLDGGESAMELRAVAVPAGLSLEPVTVRAGGTLADVKFKAAGQSAVAVVLEGRIGDRILGRTHPIVLDLN